MNVNGYLLNATAKVRKRNDSCNSQYNNHVITYDIKLFPAFLELIVHQESVYLSIDTFPFIRQVRVGCHVTGQFGQAGQQGVVTH